VTFWDRYRTPPTEPEPVPAAEAVELAATLLVQRDKALGERDAAWMELATAKREVERLKAENRELRFVPLDEAALEMKRVADEDRRNCLKMADQLEQLRREKEAVERQWAWATGRAGRVPAVTS
jgi:hypothetical protein